MKILSIDTSSKICGVTISDNENILIHLSNDDEKTHSVKLMPMVDTAFKSTNLTLDDISLLAVCTGPGSFTGVRIGIATIKAFSDVKHIPIVGVSSLESLAYNVIETDIESEISRTLKETTNTNNLGNLESTLICSLIDAKNNNVYCGLYSLNKNDTGNTFCNQIEMFAENIDIAISKIKATIVGSKAINNKISNIEVLDIENEETANNILRQKFHNIIFVGDGAIVHQEKLKTAFDFNVVPDSNIASATSTTSILVQFAEDNYNLQNSNSVAKSALSKYNQGNFGYSSSISPIYLKKSQAERALEEKIKILPMSNSDIDAITPNFETEFDKFWNINTLKNDFSNPNSTYIIAKIDDEIVGFAGFLKICDEANIMNIVTKVDKRQLGIGSKLMQALIDEAKKQNLTSITLEVNDKNFQAIKLYEKFGFKRIGLRKKYYNNTDDAIIMSL